MGDWIVQCYTSCQIISSQNEQDEPFRYQCHICHVSTSACCVPRATRAGHSAASGGNSNHPHCRTILCHLCHWSCYQGNQPKGKLDCSFKQRKRTQSSRHICSGDI